MARLSNRRTLENLREMGEHVANAAKWALRNGAYRVVADAKNRVPVRTGKLRDSIKATPNSDGSSYKISADAKNRGYSYGKVIEYANNREKAFLHPALDANRQQIRENIKDAVRQAVRRGH